jgi:hypothetical protein
MKIYLFACTLFATLAGFDLFAQTGIARITFSNGGVTDEGKIYLANGDLVAGSAYQCALYWAPAGTVDENLLLQVGSPVEFLQGTAAGYFFGGSRYIPGYYPDGTVFTFQTRAWSLLPDVPNSYEAVLAAGLAGDTRAQVGKGPVFDFKTTDPGVALSMPVTISRSPDWRGFVIGPVVPSSVPEPSTLILGAIGATAVFLPRRRR